MKHARVQIARNLPHPHPLQSESCQLPTERTHVYSPTARAGRPGDTGYCKHGAEPDELSARRNLSHRRNTGGQTHVSPTREDASRALEELAEDGSGGESSSTWRTMKRWPSSRRPPVRDPRALVPGYARPHLAAHRGCRRQGMHAEPQKSSPRLCGPLSRQRSHSP